MTVARTVVITVLKLILKITLKGLTAAMPTTTDAVTIGDILASLTTQDSIDMGIPDRARIFSRARSSTRSIHSISIHVVPSLSPRPPSAKPACTASN